LRTAAIACRVKPDLCKDFLAVVDDFDGRGPLVWVHADDVVWDLDRQLPDDGPLRHLPNVAVGEFALLGTPGAWRLMCPVPDALLDAADPLRLARIPRPLPLVYVGNQYDRDEHFGKYFPQRPRPSLIKSPANGPKPNPGHTWTSSAASGSPTSMGSTAKRWPPCCCFLSGTGGWDT
jgi:hypothetical protein